MYITDFENVNTTSFMTFWLVVKTKSLTGIMDRDSSLITCMSDGSDFEYLKCLRKPTGKKHQLIIAMVYTLYRQIIGTSTIIV